MTDGSRRVANWGELFERAIELGLGAALLTAESTQKLVNEMVNRGEVAKEESASLVDRLIVLGREQREMLRETVEKTTERVLERMNVARHDEVAVLRQRVDDLERIVMGRAAGVNPEPPPSTLTGEEFNIDQE